MGRSGNKASKEQKREAILDAAIRVFAEKGFHGSRISDVAKEAGVAEGTIYLYFRNKDDLLLSVFSKRVGAFVEDVNTYVALQKTPGDKLKAIVEKHFSHLESDPHLAQVLQIELRSCSVFMRGGASPELKLYLEIIEKVLQEGKEKKVFRDDISVKVASKAFFGMLDEVATVWVLRRKRPLSEMGNEVFSIFYQGIKKEG
jgi:TetR/AcrR family fatty acid metabolism transcriptional regulator